MFFDPTQLYNINLSNPVYQHLTNLSDHPTARNMSAKKQV